jgi:prevent-host-death family protein
MRVSITDARGRLAALIRLVEAGEQVVLTRHGHPVVRLTPVMAAVDAEARRALIEAVSASAATQVVAGPSAARSQDFLYDEDGLPH